MIRLAELLRSRKHHLRSAAVSGPCGLDSSSCWFGKLLYLLATLWVLAEFVWSTD